MTQYTDKPKRKNTPSRRRKFLLFFMLPIVALIVGAVVLSPQINAWLATDPFTPQCHFEEDRLYSAGDLLPLYSINQGQGKPVKYLHDHYDVDWSPNGQYIATLKFSIDGSYMVVLSTNGENIYTNEIPHYYTLWSPDSRYFFFGGYPTSGVVDIQTQTLAYETSQDDMSGWSPDGHYFTRYSVLRAENIGESDSLMISIIDVENGQVVATPTISPYRYVSDPYRRYSPPKRYHTWEEDSTRIYLIQNDWLMQYDLETQQSTELVELPLEGQLRNLSMLDPLTLIAITDNALIHINRETLEYRVHNAFIGKVVPIGWIPDSPYLVYYDIYREDTGQLAVLNTETFSTVVIDDNTSFDTLVSPDGRYILYLDGSDYRLYHVESRTTVPNFRVSPIEPSWIENAPQWLQVDGELYLVISQETEGRDKFQTYLWNPDTDQRCKIGITGDNLIFQPQGQQ